MPVSLSSWLSLVDPRGRCNRTGLLVAAVGLMAAQGAMALVEAGLGTAAAPLLLPVKLLVLWVAFAATARRLHDIGRSAWMMLAAMGGFIVWSIVVAVALVLTVGGKVLVPASPWFWVSFAISMAPMFAATLWLHLAPGTPGPNAYGPVPDGLGVAAPPATDQPQPA